MEEVMGKIVDAKDFLQECAVLEEKKKKMELTRKNLMKVLF